MALAVGTTAPGIGIREGADHGILLDFAVVVTDLEGARGLGLADIDAVSITGIIRHGFLIDNLVIKENNRLAHDPEAHLAEQFDQFVFVLVNRIGRITGNHLVGAVAVGFVGLFEVEQRVSLQVVILIEAAAQYQEVLIGDRGEVKLHCSLSGIEHGVIIRAGTFGHPHVPAVGHGLDLAAQLGLGLKCQPFVGQVTVPDEILNTDERVAHLSGRHGRDLIRRPFEIGFVEREGFFLKPVADGLVSRDRVRAAG